MQLVEDIESLITKDFQRSQSKCYHNRSRKRKSFEKDMKGKFFACLIIICAFFLSVTGQVKIKHQSTNPTDKNESPQFFPLSELKEGMTGTARTVFSGSEPTAFNVEILGVLPSAIGPKQDLIIGRISGGGADRTHVFAGMSGSPVYINGKLVGAISYAFPFSKEAICGITPISQMIEIFEKNQNKTAKPRKPRRFSFAELASFDGQLEFPSQAKVTSSLLSGVHSTSKLRTLAGQSFQPIATPMTFSGFSQSTLDKFAPQLLSVGLLPVSSVGGNSKLTPIKKADATTLLGGDSVVMQLTRGDYSMSAAGTVTLRNREKIYAFGHPWLSLGSSNLPMSESHVVTVVPSINNSFKLTVPDAMVGSMTQDRATGVFGKLGKVPKMIPVKINLVTSRAQQKSFNFEVAKDDFLTPILLNIAIYNSIIADERVLGGSTTEISGEIKLKDHDSVKIDRRFAGPQASPSAAASVMLPVRALMQSRFDNLEILGVELNLQTEEDVQTAVLERIGVNKTEVRAGEEFEIQAFVRADSGRIFVQKIPVKVPIDTPTGPMTVSVGDGASIQFMSATTKFVPKTLAELVSVLNKIKKSDRLYVQAHRVTKGAVIGASELPNLPPSVLATINSSRRVGGVLPTVQSLVTEQEIPPADFLISGKQTIAIEVIK